MSSSRNTFAKFTLKPSSLSQHTVNFNKILEQVPVQKIDPLDLVKPLDTIKTEVNSQQQQQQESNTLTTEKENTQTSTENQTKEFVFGEKLTDRVVNVTSNENNSNNNEKNNSNNDEIKNSQNSQNGDTGDKQSQTESKTSSLWTSVLNESEADQIEHNDVNTLLRLNCKLFLLDTDNKTKWLERGYGILKLIDSNDGLNCKIMMWTDKTFRNILNTKFFEKMQIDRANSKSIRFNANDNGSIRIFLVKTGNSNDCDELYSKLQMRFNEYLTQLESSKSTSSDLKSSEVTSSSSSHQTLEIQKRKDIQFKCDCDYIKNGDETTYKPSKIHLYHYNTLKAATNDNAPTSNSHQLLIDIVDASDDSIIYLSTYLKLIKIIKKKTHPIEFEINQIASQNVKKSTMLNNNLIIRDQETASKFLNYYDKEPTFVESSSDESELNNSDESSNENDQDSDHQVSVRKNEKVKFSDSENSENEDEEEKQEEEEEENENDGNEDEEDNDEEDDTKEQDQIIDKTNKKRKNNSSERFNSKSFKKNESDLSNTNDTDCKRSQSGDDDESSKDQAFKKTKVLEEKD